MDQLYRDLLVTDDDVTLGPDGEAVMILDRDVIAQDLVHMIRELGFLPPLVANRNRGVIDRTMVEITMAVDNDPRIVPGSAAIEEPELGRFFLTADTIEFGPVGFFLGV